MNFLLFTSVSLFSHFKMKGSGQWFLKSAYLNISGLITDLHLSLFVTYFKGLTNRNNNSKNYIYVSQFM